MTTAGPSTADLARYACLPPPDADREDPAELERLASADLPVWLSLDAQTSAADARLIQALTGMPVEDFLADVWDETPVLLRRRGDVVLQRLTAGDMWGAVASAPPDDVAVLTRGARVPLRAYTRRVHNRTVVEPLAVANAVRDGSSFATWRLQHAVGAAAELCDTLSRALSCGVSVNGFASPPGTGALNVHHDTFHVLIVQAEGEKVFEVFAPVRERPLDDERWTADRPAAEPILRAALAPGDALYMPPGFPHRVHGISECSVHFSFGMVTARYVDALARLSTALRRHPKGRAPVPAGWTAPPDVLGLVADDGDRLAAVCNALEDLNRVRLFPGLGVDAPWRPRPAFDEGAPLVRSRRLSVAVYETSDATRIVAPDRQLILPGRVGVLARTVLDPSSSACTPAEVVRRAGAESLDAIRFMFEHGVLERA